jgi:hypothetical protein
MMRKMKSSFLMLALLPFGVLAAPVGAMARDEAQYWQTLTVNAAVAGDYRLSSETVLRTSDSRGFYEIEENLMVGYAIDKHVTAYLGYTHDPNYLHGKFTVMERRFRQQVSFDNVVKLGPVTVSGRLRLEERWRQGISQTAWRLRPYVKFVLPIANKGKTTLVATHESFIDLNKTSFQRLGGEERMRNFVGINTPLVKRVNLEAGYLLQHGFVPGQPDNNDHVVSLGLTAKF